jgi:hypothetical protein
MSVHAIKNLHALVPQQNTVAVKTANKPVPTSPFSTYLGSFAPGTSTGSAQTTTTTPAPSTGFDALFSSYVSTPASATATAPATTTTPFTDTDEVGATVTAPDGSVAALNPNELASASTAAEVAQLLGGTVVNDSMGSNFASSVPTREISVPGSNVEINAGLAANLFATYGTAQGSQAWVQIDHDLGRS